MENLGRNISGKKLIKKAGLPRHVKDMSKEQLEATLKKKKECNAKAQSIVERMLESAVPQDWFLDQLKYIDGSHFQDIIEERSICKLCGYPLCAETLIKSYSNQQYHISTKFNKVYDITERKKFCSNQCYKAGRFIQDQLLTSPLWLRDKEVIPLFRLLPVGSKGHGAGEEVTFSNHEEIRLEVTELAEERKFVSVADFTRESLSQMARNKDKGKECIKEQDSEGQCQTITQKPETQSDCLQKQSHLPVSNDSSSSDSKTQIQTRCEENIPHTERAEVKVLKVESRKSVKTMQPEHTNKEVNLNESTEKPIECHDAEECTEDIKDHDKSEVKGKSEMCKSKARAQKQHLKNLEVTPVTSSVIHIEKCLYEWFSLDTMCFLFGEQKVKEMVCDKGECIKEYYKTVRSSAWDPIIQERYEVICRKLNIAEIEENKQYTLSEDRELKPLPDYSILKEEGLKMDLKIRAFYQGKTDFELPEGIKLEAAEDYTPSCILPLIDIHAQNALRRRMVLDNLKRALPDQLRTFGLSSRDISSDVRNLVSTFTLSAHNITYKPTEWSLLSLIIIKMLSVKDIRLKMLLETEQGTKYQTLMLMAFQQDGGYLERLMIWLTDLDNIMKKQKV